MVNGELGTQSTCERRHRQKACVSISFNANGPIAVTDGQTATFVIFVLPLEKEQRTQVVPRYLAVWPPLPQATVDQPIELRSNLALVADRSNGGIRRK